ncbi:ABC transporter permease [Candidatus Peregrinibacteria bacterium]|nr:ABC transporter permease [Candidatus Peregrinibacteria bacterium]
MKKHYLELVWIIAKTDFKLRYNNSVLGYFWSLLKPLLLFAVLWLVFSVFMDLGVPNYQLYLLWGIILWNFFAEGTMSGVHALSSKANIIKKIYFPRILVVIASTLTAFLSLFVSTLVFYIFMLFSGVPLTYHAFTFIPVVMLMYGLILGFSMFLSALHIKFRDIDQIWEVLIQAGFWLSPIIYPLSRVPENWQNYLLLNPITGIIQYSRRAIIEHDFPAIKGTIYILMCTIAILIIGFFVFNKLSPKAAEEL